jgi:hypothetical protein
MKNLPLGPVALVAAVVLLTAPVVLGARLVQEQQVGASHKPCVLDAGACQLRDVARFAGVFPELVASLLARHRSPTKRGQT